MQEGREEFYMSTEDKTKYFTDSRHELPGWMDRKELVN